MAIRLDGKLNRKYDQIARDWIQKYKRNLLVAWRRIRAGKNADAIVAELRATE
jgi:hypothetical protein